MRRVLFARPREFWVGLLTAGVVVVVGVEQAIIVAIALSLISHTRRGYDPHNTVLVPAKWVLVVSAGRRRRPGSAWSGHLPLHAQPVLRQRPALSG